MPGISLKREIAGTLFSNAIGVGPPVCLPAFSYLAHPVHPVRRSADGDEIDGMIIMLKTTPPTASITVDRNMVEGRAVCQGALNETSELRTTPGDHRFPRLTELAEVMLWGGRFTVAVHRARKTPFAAGHV